MSGVQLTNGVKTYRCQAPAAAGTSALNGTGVDMSGYDGVRFIYAIGALTAGQVTLLKAQGSTVSISASMADITGATTAAMADGDSDKLLILDVYRPTARYIRPVLSRATQNAVVDIGVAELYRVKKQPVTADTTVAAQAIVLGV